MSYRDQGRLDDVTVATIPWSQMVRMRDHLAHRYWDTNHAIVQATVDNDLDQLDAAIGRMRRLLDDD